MSSVPRGCPRCWNLVKICDVTNGVSMFILPMFLSGIFFNSSLFSHSDSYVDICNHCVAWQTCLSHNRVFEVNVVDLRLDVFRFVAKKQASQKGSFFRSKFAMHVSKTSFGKWVFHRKVALLFLHAGSLNVILYLNIADIFWTDQFQLS